MYENFFGLSCLPFEDRIQLEFFYKNSDLEEVLASMECELRYRQGLGFLVGESGTGKTLLVRALLTKLDAKDAAVVIRCPADGQMDMIRETCKGFGVTLPTQYNAKRGLARLRRRLEDARRQDKLPVLIVDQAENLSVEAMATLESLIDLSRDDNRLLTMILVGQPRTIDMLGQPKFDRLRQQLASELRLHKFTSAQTHDYITHRLCIAGAGDNVIFDPAAIAVIHIVTHGVPRLINRLADASMVAAYSAGQACVTAELVREMSAQQSQKSQPSRSIRSVVQEDAQMSNLVSRVDSTIQAMKGDDIKVSGSSYIADDSTNISERARSLITKLEQTLRHSEQTTSKLERRAKAIVVEVQDQLNELENETTRVSGIATEVQPQLQRIENTCDRAVKVEAQLSTFAETLVERADSVQQRISLLMTSMTDADACRENINATAQQAMDTVNEAQQSAQVAQAATKQAKKDLDENKRIANESVDHVRTQLCHIEEDASRTYKLFIENERKNLAGSFRDAIKDSLDGFKKNLLQETEKMKADFLTGLHEQIQHVHSKSMADIEKLTDVKESTFRLSVDAVAKEVSKTFEYKAEQTRNELTQLQSDVTTTVQTSSKELAQISQQHEQTWQRLKSQIQSNVMTAVQTSSKELEQLSEQHEQAWQRLKSQNVTHQDQLVSLAAKSTDMAEQINDLTVSAKTAEKIVQQSKLSVSYMQQASQRAQADLTSTMDQARAITSDVTNASGQVESLQRSISSTLLEVGGAYERLNSLRENVVRVESMSGRFDNIETLVKQANKAVEQLQPAVVAADEKAGRLQSHHAAATSLLNKLTQANIDGQSVVKKVEETSSKVDRMIQDVWGLATKAEASSQEIAAALADMKNSGQQKVSPTNSNDVKVQSNQLADDVALRSEAYEKLTDQVNTIAKVLSKAQEVAKSTREELVDAKETYENLTTITGAANQQVVSLDTLIKSAGGMIETHEQLQLETATSTQELKQHISAMADTTDAGMQMINEFTKQTIDIEKQLRTATRKSAQLQANVAEALAQPGEIVAGAKEQAIQLEQVCTAVRKVFSALSQTSLEAQEKIAMFNQSKALAQTEFDKLKQSTGQAVEGIRSLGQTNIKQIKNIASQASEGIQSMAKSSLGNLQSTAKQAVEHVRNESNRSSATLSEWVQETKRAQQRLEHTLKYVPSISQTHPINSVSQDAQQIPAFNGPEVETATSQGYDLLVEKRASVESVTMQGDDQTERKAKIKKLLEEARRVSVSARS